MRLPSSGFALLVATSVLVGGAAPTQAVSIRISGDLCGYSCEAWFPSGQSTAVYVLAWSGDGTNIHGAQYRISGFPAEWVVVVENAPFIATAVGNVLVEGTHLILDDCQAPPDDSPLLPLQTLRVIPTSFVTNVEVRVEKALAPLNLLHAAPVLETCTESGMLAVECFPSFFYLNAQFDPCPFDCWPAETCSTCNLVSVQPSTWDAVKSLYR